MSKRTRRLTITVTVFLLLVGALVWWLEVAPRRASIEQLEIENATLQTQLQRDRATANLLYSERDQAAAWEEAKEFMRILLPAEVEIPQMLDRVEKLLRATGLQLGSLTVRKMETDSESGLFVVPVNFSVTATYERFMSLLEDLEESVNRVQVDMVTYSQAGNTLQGQVNLKVFLDSDDLLDPAEDVEQELEDSSQETLARR